MSTTGFVIGQIMGILAMILTFLSYQANTKKWVLIIQTVGTAFTAASYFFLGAGTGLILNLVCIGRNLVFYFQKTKTRASTVSSILFAAAMIALGALSFEGWYSLLLLAALAANTIFLSLGNPQLLRKSILVTSTMVLIYNCFVLSLGGIASESLAIISSAIGILRFRKGRKQQNS